MDATMMQLEMTPLLLSNNTITYAHVAILCSIELISL